MNKTKILNGTGIGFAVMTLSLAFILLAPFLFPSYLGAIVFRIINRHAPNLSDLAQVGFILMIALIFLFQIGWIVFLTT